MRMFVVAPGVLPAAEFSHPATHMHRSHGSVLVKLYGVLPRPFREPHIQRQIRIITGQEVHLYAVVGAGPRRRNTLRAAAPALPEAAVARMVTLLLHFQDFREFLR